jgi:hypothetical protein
MTDAEIERLQVRRWQLRSASPLPAAPDAIVWK